MFPGLPPDFPAPSLPIMRVLCAVANSGNSEKLTQALDTFFSEHWAKGVATHKPEVLKATLEGLWGVEEAERRKFSCFMYCFSSFIVYLCCVFLLQVIPGISSARDSPILPALFLFPSSPLHHHSHPISIRPHPFPPSLPSKLLTIIHKMPVLALSTTLEIKTALTANTDAAFDTGAFGLPWMVCTDSQGKTEGFWGVDHLGQVVQFLGLDKGSGEGRGWRAVL